MISLCGLLPLLSSPRFPKEAGPAFDDQIATVRDEMGTQVFEYLDSITLMWTTIDAILFAKAEEDSGPIDRKSVV